MKKIAIITLYGNYNFGNKLQNYAVQKLMQERSFECRTIRFIERDRLVGWKGRLIALLGFPRKLAEKKRFLMKLENIFSDFSDKYLITGERLHFSQASVLCDKYDYFITGSDQVWHNWTDTKQEAECFFLTFADAAKRFCISPSFGFDSVPKKYEDLYIKGLEGFRHLSCREESGCHLIKQLTGRDAELLCDPTMALTAEQWNEIAEKPDFEIPEKYILTYFLGDVPEDAEKYTEKLSKETGVPVIRLYSSDHPEYLSVMPQHFLYLIRGAQHFVTNSFHGCVFSIIYHTPFSAAQRIELNGMENRISTLINKFGLKSTADSDDQLRTFSDFENADRIMDAERKKMHDYLDRIFSDI